MWAALPEIARELRFWGPSNSSGLPFWLAGLLAILCCCFGCCLGVLCTALALSAAARRAIAHIA